MARFAMLALASMALPAEAPSTNEAARTFALSGARTAAVRSYTSRLHVDIALRSAPYLRFHLEGHVDWERPNLYSVHFDHVPWFGKGFEHIRADALEPQTWPSQYDVTSLARRGDRTLVEMHDRVAGNVRDVHAELDPDGLRRIVWQYVNGGRVDVQIQPKPVDGVPLPAEETADIKLPAYHVYAHATFTDYKIVTDSAGAGNAAR